MGAIEENIKTACDLLYRERKYLIANKIHERTIATYLRDYLRPLFKDWTVDTDYNRVGMNRDTKRGPEGRPIVPDIIIHTQGVPQGSNLVAIQMKGFWNKESRSKDEKDLKRLAEALGYQNLFRLELGPEDYDLIRINP